VIVNDLQSETGGLPFGLHLDSTATREDSHESTALASQSDASGMIDKHPVLIQSCRTRSVLIDQERFT
jgi:hypothetical protein